jgi:hypothetical protein
MERDDITRDDFIAKLIREVPLDSPSDDFVERVMAGITIEQEVIKEKRPFYYYIRKSLPYAASILLVMLVIFTSDLQVINHLPGMNYFSEKLIPYLSMVVETFRGAFSTRFVSFGILTGLSAGMLFLIDRFVSHRFSA